jgi:hypothetical protein
MKARSQSSWILTKRSKSQAIINVGAASLCRGAWRRCCLDTATQRRDYSSAVQPRRAGLPTPCANLEARRRKKSWRDFFHTARSKCHSERSEESLILPNARKCVRSLAFARDGNSTQIRLPSSSRSRFSRIALSVERTARLKGCLSPG